MEYMDKVQPDTVLRHCPPMMRERPEVMKKYLKID